MTTNSASPLYLSRLILNPSSRQVWSELAHPYEMHRTLIRAFPPPPDEQKEKIRAVSGMLFRADADDKMSHVIVYVQSTIQPDWLFLKILPDYLIANEAEFKNVSPSYQRLHDGQILAFRLRANPTKRIGRSAEGESDLKGKRVGLLREEEQIIWLIQKGKVRAQDGKEDIAGGFELLMTGHQGLNGVAVPKVLSRSEGMQAGRKHQTGHSGKMTHLAVRFDGYLRITDADAFRATLASGIGSAKAFGFGLLSIAPICGEN